MKQPPFRLFSVQFYLILTRRLVCHKRILLRRITEPSQCGRVNGNIHNWCLSGSIRYWHPWSSRRPSDGALKKGGKARQFVLLLSVRWLQRRRRQQLTITLLLLSLLLFAGLLKLGRKRGVRIGKHSKRPGRIQEGGRGGIPREGSVIGNVMQRNSGRQGRIGWTSICWKRRKSAGNRCRASSRRGQRRNSRHTQGRHLRSWSGWDGVQLTDSVKVRLVFLINRRLLVSSRNSTHPRM